MTESEDSPQSGTTDIDNSASVQESSWSLLKRAITGQQQDFTSGNLNQAIFLLSIPMILEMLMESTFALVDIVFVSFISTNAVATVGLTESVITLLYALAIGLSMGATALVSRRIGEKDNRGATEAAVQAIFVGICLSLMIAVLGVMFPKDILFWMGGEQDLVEDGYRYTQILIGGNITIMLLFLINAIFRGAGDASVAMWVLVLSNGLNIVLDPIFIFGLGPVPAFGVEGAAIATTIGRGTAVMLQLAILLLGWGRIRIGLSNLRLNIAVMWNLIRVSLGGIGQFLIGTSSWVFLMRIMSEFGSDVVAGYTIAIRVMMFTLMPSWGMSNAAATLVGQNLGANQADRAEESVWITSRVNAILMVSISAVYLVFARQIIACFSDQPEVIRHGALTLQIVAAGYVFYAYGMVVTQAFNGAGDTKTPTVINLICFWLIQLPLAYATAITFQWGPVGVLVAITLAEALIAIIAVCWFRRGTWKLAEV